MGKQPIVHTCVGLPTYQALSSLTSNGCSTQTKSFLTLICLSFVDLTGLGVLRLKRDRQKHARGGRRGGREGTREGGSSIFLGRFRNRAKFSVSKGKEGNTGHAQVIEHYLPTHEEIIWMKKLILPGELR